MIPALVNHLWQSTLFALGAGLLTLTVRRNGAGVRYGLWLAASVKFLVPFALLASAGEAAVARLHLMLAPPPGFAMPSLAMIAPVVEPLAPAPVISAPTSVMPVPATLPAPPHAAIPAHHAMAVPFDPALILLGVWALGLAMVVLVWAVRWSRIRAAIRAASPIDLPAPVPVLSSPALLEPGVVGVRRPVLLVPEGIAERLSPAELRAVIDHELCHIRRRDNLTGAIHMLVEALFWFHPLVWWLGARLIAERERACDEAVVRAGANPRTYAEAILKVCRLYLQQPLACAAGVSGADLKQRMRRIMADPISLRLGVPKKLMLAAAAVLSVAAPVSAGLFASAPMAARAASADAVPSKPGASGAARQALEAQTPAAPQAVTPIVLAALETALSPVPAVAHADSKDGQVVAGLSQAAPDLPAIAAAPSQPASAPAVTQAAGDAQAQASSFVKSYAATTRWFGQIPRWDRPICVSVQGLKPDQTAAVTARVLAVANAAGVGAPRSLVQPWAPWNPPTCQGSTIQIVFTNQPQRVLDNVAAHNGKLLGDSPADAKTRTITRPIQAWYMIDAEGGWTRGNIAALPDPISQFVNVMVIVDLRRTGDKPQGLIADYAAMLALSQPRSPDRCNVLPSVTDLFAGPCPGRGAPDGLTPTDTAYLTALYGRPDIDMEGDPSDIANRMARILAVAPNPPPSGSGALAQPVSAPATKAAAPVAQAVPADPKAKAASFVRSYAATSPWPDRIARWETPICVNVEGLAQDQAAAVIARIKAVAGAAGVGAPRSLIEPPPADFFPTCQGSTVQIVFTKQPQRVLDDVAARKDKLLGDDPPDAKTLGAITRPIQAWYLTGNWLNHGRGAPDPRSNAFTNVLVIVDLRRTGDMRLSLITDYAAMLALSQPRSPDHCNVLSSVTDLFAGSCPGRGAPDGLTPADTAYLTALYGEPEIDMEGDPSDIASRMAHLLAATKVAAR